MVACSNCGRNFAEDRIEKHEDICLKTAKKKRKTFDMTKKRVQGTDAESFVLPKGKRGITSKGTSTNAVAATSVSASKQVFLSISIKRRSVFLRLIDVFN